MHALAPSLQQLSRKILCTCCIDERLSCRSTALHCRSAPRADAARHDNAAAIASRAGALRARRRRATAREADRNGAGAADEPVDRRARAPRGRPQLQRHLPDLRGPGRPARLGRRAAPGGRALREQELAPPEGEGGTREAIRRERREPAPDDQPVRAGSRKDRRRRKAADAWTADDALDAEHAVHGRGAARFLSVRDFASHAEVIAAVRAVPRCELWCSDLGQDASVLADGAPWLRGPLPHRVALVFGTESTGVSNELLAACDRRVYVPQHGFADSLNVGVAAALATSHVLKLVGGGGDLVEATDWVPDAPDELRRKWAGVLCRDEAQLAAVRAAAGEVAVLDDLRRAPEFRGHTGRPTKLTRRAEFRKRRALEGSSGSSSTFLNYVCLILRTHSRVAIFSTFPPGGWS